MMLFRQNSFKRKLTNAQFFRTQIVMKPGKLWVFIYKRKLNHVLEVTQIRVLISVMNLSNKTMENDILHVGQETAARKDSV